MRRYVILKSRLELRLSRSFEFLNANQRRLDTVGLRSRGAKLREIVALVSLNITGAIYALRS